MQSWEENMIEDKSLGEILVVLRKHLGKIIIWSLLGILTTGLYTFFFVVPNYESTSKIVVNQTQNTSQSITNVDIQTNLNLINTYQNIIEEPIILEDAIQATDSNLTVEELKRKIIVQTQTDSLVFGISVSDESPYRAAELANAISRSFESKIGDILEVQSVTILSEATPNVNAVSPNILMNLMFGLIIGIMIGIGLSFLTEMTNKTVKDEKFIELLGWTNLGSILEMSTEEVKNTRINMKKNIRQHAGRVSQRRV